MLSLPSGAVTIFSHPQHARFSAPLRFVTRQWNSEKIVFKIRFVFTTTNAEP